jgi:hypothetical protein
MVPELAEAVAEVVAEWPEAVQPLERELHLMTEHSISPDSD